MYTEDLSGYWDFEYHTGPKIPAECDFDETIKLPGTMDEANLGNPVKEKTPWHLNRKAEYTGPAFYKRTVVIPKAYEGKHIELFLERCHWESTVYVDGVKIGSQESLCVPHRYDLSEFLTQGNHTIILKIDNSYKYDIGNLAHAVTDHTQTNWNGVIGRIELRVSDEVMIDSLNAVPDIDNGTVKVKTSLRNYLKGENKAVLKFSVINKLTGKTAGEKVLETSLTGEIVNEEVLLNIDSAELWDEFTPNLYTLKAEIKINDGDRNIYDSKKIDFGMINIKSDKDGFTINKRPLFLRGTLDCCVFPISGAPSMSLADWLTRLNVAKDYGFNHVRFHSWCPPEAAFVAGDMLGLYFQVETPNWTCLGEKPEVDKFITEESLRIIDEYGSHPSFSFMAAGNEPSGDNKEEFLLGAQKKWREKGAAILFTGCSGWPELSTSDYHVLKNRPGALRCQDWAEELDGRLNKKPFDTDYDYSKLIEGAKKPVVSHEVGQWCAFPDFDEMKKYTGVLTPDNFKIFKDLLEKKGLSDLAEKFKMASGRFQVAEYKEDIEAALRTPKFGGFQLLGLTDFSGQGTAIVGVLNAFCESKGYINAKEFRTFCCETVMLARMKKVLFTDGENFNADITAANYGKSEFKNVAVDWSLLNKNGEVKAAGSIEDVTIPFGSGKILGKAAVPLKAEKSEALTFTVKLRGTKYQNFWKIWVFKKPQMVNKEDITVTRDIKKAEEELKSGGRVLYMPKAEDFINNKMPSGFTTVFWNYEFTSHQAPRSLGILCDPNHPALQSFPTEYHCEWQWFDLITHSKFMVLDKCKKKIDPIIRVIDDWNTSDSFGVLFEAKIGKGRLMMCSLDLLEENRPETNELYSSIVNYMKSEKFDPKTELENSDIEELLTAEEDRKTKLFDYRDVVHVD